jgi:hypothetical protein
MVLRGAVLSAVFGAEGFRICAATKAAIADRLERVRRGCDQAKRAVD